MTSRNVLFRFVKVDDIARVSLRLPKTPHLNHVLILLVNAKRFMLRLLSIQVIVLHP